jgi:histidine triad (HIT) family protein
MEGQQCIFCGIASGGIPSKKIYEDDKIVVVLDIYPANPAHLLILTKNHYAIFNQLSKDEVEHLGLVCKRISELLFKVLKPEGINFFIANGAVAGQKAPHLILHAIPRFSGDGLNFEIPVNMPNEKEFDDFYQNLKKTLKNYFPKVDFEEPAEAESPEEEEKEAEKHHKDGGEKKEPEKSDEIDLDKITEMFS